MSPQYVWANVVPRGRGWPGQHIKARPKGKSLVRESRSGARPGVVRIASVEFRDRLGGAGQDGGRPVADVVDHGVRVDAEVAVDGGQNVLVVKRLVLGRGRDAVGGADHLTHLHAAARQQG